MAQLASLLVPIGDLPKPDTSWIGNIAKSLGGAIDQASENKSFNTLADRIGGAPAPAQQQGGFLSRLMGANQQPAASPAPQRGRSMAISGIDPSIKSGIVSTANSLGIDPADLATAISYETGGTFDPTKSGPTTQWGQHRGLIQFGEPQAQKYGVNWEDPIGSQLGENGAVAKYLRDTGVQPGMGLMDIYSAINAGGVGRNGASDANNGGAPGTVADKVNSQMSGHRQRALALLAAGGQPQAGGNVVASLDPSVGIPMPGASGQMRAGDPSQMAPQGVDMSAQQPSMQQPAPAQVADSGPSMIAQGITPIQRGGVDPEMIQFMLRDPNLRQAGLQLWQQNATGKTSEPWQFVTLPDGTLARANQQTGQVEKVGQFSKPQDPISVSEGETLLDPVTKQPIYQGQSNKPPVIQEFFDDQTGQAYKAEFNPETREWKRVGGVKAPNGMSITTNPDGTVSIQQGVGGKPKLTEAEARNSGFLVRAKTAQETLNTLEDQGTSVWNATAGKIPVAGNYLRSEEAQKYDQAKRNFINAQLRRESGAVISPEEFANAEQQYFPQPGDGPEVIRQKRINRQDAIRGLDIGSGAGAALTDPAKPPAQAGNAADLDAARDAIRRGAPRDKVIERLRAAGIDTEGL
jgi:hypothetical protein